MMTENTIRSLNGNQDQINKIQQQISSGKLIQTPSEDPINASLSLQLKTSLSVSKGYQQTAALAKDWMSTADTSLDKLEELGSNAQNILLSGLNDTADASLRASSLAPELSAIITQIVDLGNSKYMDNYVFSGVKVDTPAFDANTFAYQGISKTMYRSIGQNNKLVLNINGDEAISPLLQAVINARDQLAANDTTNLPNTLNDLKNALNTLTTARSANAARMQQVDDTISYLEKSDSGITAILTEKEDTNMAEADSTLLSYQNTYQTVLEVGSRTLSALNLFDYLQK
jgi:flagellar hook-associated protein 3 FlgL